MATYMALELHDKLDKFLSLLGALTGAPLAIFYPALIHLKQMAVTKNEKILDISLIATAVAVLVFSTS